MLKALKALSVISSVFETTGTLLSILRNPSNRYRTFSPESGRWLWNEEFQRSRHTRIYDVRALEDVVATAMGEVPGKGLVRIRKLAEGASNKVFTATLRDKRVIVKLPDPVVPPRLVTASEVATLEYLRTELALPVPRVLAWSSSSDNPVGCEYIIMDEVSGDPLNLVWNSSFEDGHKIAVVEQVHEMQCRLLRSGVQLGGYGSLYFLKDAKAFGFKRQLAVTNKNGPTQFCLGPLAHRKFMHPEVIKAGIDCGPWTSPQDYLVAAIDCSISKVKGQQEGCQEPELADKCFDFPHDVCSDVSTEAALSLLHQYRLAAPSFGPSVSNHAGLTQPVLWHEDLHMGNIFADPKGSITGIIDWQDTYCLPVFFQADVPRFCDFYQGSELVELPQNYSTMPEGEEKNEIMKMFVQTKLQQYYLSLFEEDPSKILGVFQNPQTMDLRDLVVSVAGRSFTRPADFLLLREVLRRLRRHWSDLLELSGSGADCPVSIGDEELAKHQADGKQWNSFQDILKNRSITTDQAGWVRKEDFNKEKENLRLVIEEILNSLESEEHHGQFKKNVELWKLTE